MISSLFSSTVMRLGAPRLALDFKSASLDSRITFTRTGATATRVNASGLIEAVAANTPRFDFDPVTLACRGLLIEQARSNIRTYSEDFSNAVWTPMNLNQTGTPAWVNAATAPDGNATADKLIPNTTLGRHRVVGGAQDTTTGQRYAMSVFLKKGGNSKAAIGEFNNGVGWGAFDLNAGTVIASGGVGSPSVYITPYKNDWYRCEVVFTAQAYSRFDIYVLGDSYTSGDPNNTGNYFSGNDSNGVFVWGAQLELGDRATSYIANTATGSTSRNADVAAITGANFSAWWTSGAGTVLADVFASTANGVRPVVQFDDGTADNLIALRGNGADPELYIKATTDQAQIDAGTIAANTRCRWAAAWAVNNCAASVNSATPAFDGAATVPTVTQARLGSDGTNYLNGWLESLEYYDRRPLNSSLQVLSSAVGWRSMISPVIRRII